MELTPRELVGRALELLASRLDGIITERLAAVLGGLEWTSVLSELDRMKGKDTGRYLRQDVQVQLRVLTERLGALGYPLDDGKRTVSTLGSELRMVRNQYAHMYETQLVDAWRAADFVVRLLQHFGDQEGLTLALTQRDNIMRVGSLPEQEQAASGTREVTPTPAGKASVTTAEVLADAEATQLEEPENSATRRVTGSTRPGFEPWTLVRIGESSVLDGLRSSRNSDQVRSAVEEIVEFEGPVARDRVVKLVARAFGLGRMESKRAKAIGHQVAKAAVRCDDYGFLWPEEVAEGTWTGFRPHTNGAVFRPIDEIAPTELANAARYLMKRHPEEDREQLEARVTQTFGFKRRMPKVKAQLAAMWDVLSAGASESSGTRGGREN